MRLNQIIKLLLILTTVSILEAAYSGGFGTQSVPYRLANNADFELLSTNTADWSAYFVVISNVNFSTASFEGEIGNNSVKFTGNFDGQGFQLDSLTISKTTDRIGLFGVIGASGLVENVNLINADVEGHDKVGILAGQNDGLIRNSSASGLLTANKKAGGLVGINDGMISNSFVNVIAEADKELGGLCGISNGDLYDSYSRGSLTATKSIGGLKYKLVGVMYNCYSIAAVADVPENGALVAKKDRKATFADSYWNTNDSSTIKNKAGTKKTQTQMKTKSTYATWDLRDLWYVNTNNYPILRHVATSDLDKPSALGAPAADLGENAFTATWKPVTGADRYHIDVLDATSFVVEDLYVGNVTNVQISGLSPNSDYEFRIRAYSASKVSVDSDTLVVQTTPEPSILGIWALVGLFFKRQF